VNLHGPVRAAELEGKAEVVISLDAWAEGKVAPTTHEVAVLPPKKGARSEPVTGRLIKTLPHPDRKATVGDVRFSDDGARLMMTGYPSGVVQIWDTKTWKETARLDTPSGLRSSLVYATPTPDWKTILVHVRTRKLVREEKGGKVQQRLQIDGRVDLYDAGTGKLRDSVAFADRGPMQLFLAPDGKTALVNTEGSFTAENAAKRPAFTELLDLASKTTKTLLDSQAYPAFSQDGKTVYLSKYEFQANGSVAASLVKYDLAAGKAVKSVNAPDDQTFFDSVTLSPDGKWVVASPRKLKPPSTALVILSSDTLEEVARIPGPKDAERNAYFATPRFSPDGRTMITRCDGPLLVWDLVAKKIVRTVPVGDFQYGLLALSPDGKRAVVSGMPKFDVKSVGRDPDPEDLPQPRVVVVDLTEPKGEPQVLVLPHGPGLVRVAFSPDGRTLAVGSTGGAHLLDVSGGK
jgi:WD40 repeat protein